MQTARNVRMQDIWHIVRELHIRRELAACALMEEICAEYLTSNVQTITLFHLLLLLHCCWYMLDKGSAPSLVTTQNVKKCCARFCSFEKEDIGGH